MKSKVWKSIAVLAVAAFLASGWAAVTAAADEDRPYVRVWTSKDEYSIGDTLHLYLLIENFWDKPLESDMYIAASSGGKYYFWPYFSPDPELGRWPLKYSPVPAYGTMEGKILQMKIDRDYGEAYIVWHVALTDYKTPENIIAYSNAYTFIGK